MKKAVTFVVLTALLILLSYFSLNVGNYSVAPKKVLAMLGNRLFNTEMPQTDNYEEVVVFDLRLPRMLMVIMVGAALAVSGGVSQGVFRNPLVSPFVLGISAGASFGAAVAIVFFGHIAYSIDILAGLGGLVAVLAAFAIARRPDGYMPRLSLVLAGVIVSSLFTSLVGIIKYVADVETQLPAITFWMMGGFGNIDWGSLDYVIYLIPISIVLMIVFAWQLNVLAMGDREASFLGMNIKFWKSFYLFLSVAAVGMCVARSGVIGWVGLVIPHISRAVGGPDHKTMLPLSALLGAIFLLVADNISRTITTGDIPVGIITSIIGAPFFIYYLRKKETAVWN